MVVAHSYREFFDKYGPIVVPPTWKKGELSPLLGEVWQHAYEYISTARRICVIGYSMPSTDLFFRHIMAACLSKNLGLYGLFVVDRSLENEGRSEVDDRYRDRFEPLVSYKKYEFFGGGVLNFLNPHHLKEIGRGRLIKRIEQVG